MDGKYRAPAEPLCAHEQRRGGAIIALLGRSSERFYKKMLLELEQRSSEWLSKRLLELEDRPSERFCKRSMELGEQSPEWFFRRRRCCWPWRRSPRSRGECGWRRRNTCHRGSRWLGGQGRQASGGDGAGGSAAAPWCWVFGSRGLPS